MKVTQLLAAYLCHAESRSMSRNKRHYKDYVSLQRLCAPLSLVSKSVGCIFVTSNTFPFPVAFGNLLDVEAE